MMTKIPDGNCELIEEIHNVKSGMIAKIDTAVEAVCDKLAEEEATTKESQKKKKAEEEVPKPGKPGDNGNPE